MRRQQGRDPQTRAEVLQRQIDELDAGVRQLRSPGATTIQAIDTTVDAPNEYLDPSQGEIAIDHPTEKVRFFHAGIWRDIGGGDPEWAAIYSGNLLWGHTVSSTGNALELFGPSFDQSDSSTGLFTFTSYADPGLVMPQIYRMTLHASGLYTFGINVAWFDPEVPEMRNTYYIGRHSGGSFDTPGDIAQPFVNIKLSAGQYHNLNNFSDWDFTHAVSWTVPVLISAPCEIKPMVAHEAANAAGTVVTVDNPYDLRFFVIYHGPVKHAASSFDVLD